MNVQADAINPLTQELLVNLNMVLEETPRIAQYLAKLEDCGLEVADAVKENDEAKRLAGKIKAHFFPGEP